MAQTPTSQHFCTQCGTTVDVSQSTCPQCGQAMDARYARTSQGQNVHNPDATVRLLPPDTDATVRLSWPAFDATVKGPIRLSSRMYLRAARQEAAHLPVSEKLALLDKETSARSTSTGPLAKSRSAPRQKRFVIIGSVCCLILLALLIASSVIDHASDHRAEAQAAQSRGQLDRLIAQARFVGVPPSSLRPIIEQEARITHARTLVTLFHNPLATNFYRNQAAQYGGLQRRVPTVIMTATQQLQAQAERDMQNFQSALAQANTQPVGNIHAISYRFSQDQILLASARLPKDYSAISADARDAIATLSLMESTFSQISDFGSTLGKLKDAHVDVTSMQLQYQNDLDAFNKASRMADFQDLTVQMNAQYQQLVVASVRAFPYISITKLNELRAQIQTLQTYGLNPSAYQKRFDADEIATQRATTIYDELVTLKQIDADIASMHSDLVRGEASYVVTQFHREVDAWAKAHPYRDRYDGHNYALNNGYMTAGLGKILDSDLANASGLSDLEGVITEAQNALFNLHMFEDNYDHQASYNHIHPTDLQMLAHYRLQNKQVLMVSLTEQAMRIYQDGKLVRSYQVTTGRQELPSIPGVWSVLDRRSPVIFKAADSKGSPYWFPDTPISYAILYHYGGYYVHDAPWRGNVGPGTQFPHEDVSGTTAYNFDGSHGCVNLQESAADWVYHHTDWNTLIVIY